MSLQHKSVEDLNKTIWYRFLKVIYIVTFVSVYLISVVTAIASLQSALMSSYHQDTIGYYYLYIAIAVFVPPLVFWLFAGIFNYIIIGQFILPKLILKNWLKK